MSRTGRPLRLHGSVAQALGIAIVSGRYRPGHILDGEIEASDKFEVSRTVYREAVRILSAKGLVASKPRAGTRVSEREQWHLMDPDVLAWIFSGTPDPDVLRALFELRAILEPAAAGIAAQRRTSTQLDAMRDGLDTMRKHTLHTKQGLEGDKAFHAALLAASDNPFLISLTNGVTAAVGALNEFKQRVQPLRRDPVPDHERVYDAIAEKNSEAAQQAMRDLLRLAIADTPMAGSVALKRPRPKPRRS